MGSEGVFTLLPQFTEAMISEGYAFYFILQHQCSPFVSAIFLLFLLDMLAELHNFLLTSETLWLNAFEIIRGNVQGDLFM
ncbi:hypothetical protein PHAVU_007G080000 [Phaseolus vulgaris]|uniref:Uncharacterized protein n=1 Tax=Phaseolus vulgaris TaxID=3885 RepID=V7BF55_PHAVU|nr:hypothetical protein PHAVU_007G080000g [Phaseolus vulgaris]ESW15533.1 hypothetical protein PHAVU_007G080000g [Phaseolus vulgaris]